MKPRFIFGISENRVPFRGVIYSLLLMTSILFLPLTAQAHDCVSGNCVNGKGTMNYSNGDKYVGEFKNNQ